MRRSLRIPTYRLHKARGLAVVTIGGHNHYLGPFGSSESHARYATLIAEWQRSAASETRLSAPTGPSFTIGELALAYLEFAVGYYTKNGEPTSQIHTERAGLRALVALYHTEQAAAFGPLKLKNIQQHLMGRDLARSTINSFSAAIKRAFKWAASEELIPESVSNSLRAVGGLKRGRSGAKETEPIRPVDEGTVSATIPHLSPVLAAMVQLQLLTGMRPGEVCRLRPADVTIGKSGTWTYRPSVHKTEHHEGRERRIFIGPEGQGVLRPYLDRDPDAYCFSPRESVGQPGSAAARRRPGSRYTSASYRRAITRACERAGLEEWKPNQLRHTAATLIRERYGMEAAATVLGHSDPRVTAIYAERNFKLASDVIQKIG